MSQSLGSRRVWFAAGALAGVATLVTLGMNWRREEQNAPPHRVAPIGVPAAAPPSSTVAAVHPRALAPPTVAAPSPKPEAKARAADSLAARIQLDLMGAQRRALIARQAAVDSGAAIERVRRGDQLMRTADSAITRRRYDAAMQAMQDAERTWQTAAQTAGAGRLPNPPTTVAAPSSPPSSTVSVPTPPAANAAPATKVAPVDPLPGIQAAITSYAHALESRDVAQLRAAYPALTADEAHRWQDIFDATNKLSATLTAVAPAHVTADGAEVDVTATFDFDYKHGMAGDRHPTLTYHAVLARDGQHWKLTSIR